MSSATSAPPARPSGAGAGRRCRDGCCRGPATRTAAALQPRRVATRRRPRTCTCSRSRRRRARYAAQRPCRPARGHDLDERIAERIDGVAQPEVAHALVDERGRVRRGAARAPLPWRRGRSRRPLPDEAGEVPCPDARDCVGSGRWLALPPVTQEQANEPEEYRQYRFSLPEGATDLLIVRHGESAPARPDAPAPTSTGTATRNSRRGPRAGREAGRAAGARAHRRDLRHHPAPHRADRGTARQAARASSRVVEPDLREVYLGEWEGFAFRKYVAEAASAGAADVRGEALGRHPRCGEPTSSSPPGCVPGSNGSSPQHPGQRVVVVAHGGVIGQCMSLATGAPAFNFMGADNASISQIVALPPAVVRRLRTQRVDGAAIQRHRASGPGFLHRVRTAHLKRPFRPLAAGTCAVPGSPRPDASGARATGRGGGMTQVFISNLAREGEKRQFKAHGTRWSAARARRRS